MRAPPHAGGKTHETAPEKARQTVTIWEKGKKKLKKEQRYIEIKSFSIRSARTLIIQTALRIQAATRHGAKKKTEEETEKELPSLITDSSVRQVMLRHMQMRRYAALVRI